MTNQSSASTMHTWDIITSRLLLMHSKGWTSIEGYMKDWESYRQWTGWLKNSSIRRRLISCDQWIRSKQHTSMVNQRSRKVVPTWLYKRSCWIMPTHSSLTNQKQKERIANCNQFYRALFRLIHQAKCQLLTMISSREKTLTRPYLNDAWFQSMEVT